MTEHCLTGADADLCYHLQLRRRGKTIRYCVKPDQTVLVTAPAWCSKKVIEDGLRLKLSWILSKQKFFRERERLYHPAGTRQEYLACKQAAMALVQERIRYFCERHPFVFNRFQVKCHQRCWGSCSARKNLNFNYRILFLPAQIVDYIILHELCHLKELNHSPRFWSLVEEFMPDYRVAYRALCAYRAKAT